MEQMFAQPVKKLKIPGNTNQRKVALLNWHFLFNAEHAVFAIKNKFQLKKTLIGF